MKERIFNLICILAAGWGGSLSGQAPEGDSARGESALRNCGCVRCHRLNGGGGNSAPDLGKRVARSYSSGRLAGVLWNHAGVRWNYQADQGALSGAEAADMLAYFVSRRYFEAPGDARRGKQVFAAAGCSRCHGITEQVEADAKPVAGWDGLRDPVALTQALYNCARRMSQTFQQRGIPYPRLSARQINDLLVYADNLPAARGRPARFQLASAGDGRALFLSKGCGNCHHGTLSLENRTFRFTMAALAAAAWNHGRMGGSARTPLSYDETSALVNYLWSIRSRGDCERGRSVFRSKCAGCHDDSAPASLSGGGAEPPLTLVAAALWNKGPSMRAAMARKGLPWPQCYGIEMADLAAYLGTRHQPFQSEVRGGVAGSGALLVRHLR